MDGGKNDDNRNASNGREGWSFNEAPAVRGAKRNREDSCPTPLGSPRSQHGGFHLHGPEPAHMLQGLEEKTERTNDMKIFTTLLCSVLLISASACATQPNDGWRHTGWSPSTASLYTCGDYAITERGKKFTLIFRAGKEYKHIGTFATLAAAKQAAQ